MNDVILTSKASIVISRLRSALAQLLVEYEDVPDATDADGQALFQEARNAIAAADRYSGETGEQQPVAYVPIHPRTGPLWANTIPTLESERPAHYPLMALYAEPAYRDGKETVVRTNQGDSDCVMTGDWPLTRERDAASHPPSCVCYTCIQNRWRASQKASEVRTWICPNCKSENRDDYHRISCPGCGKLRPPSSSEEV